MRGGTAVFWGDVLQCDNVRRGSVGNMPVRRAGKQLPRDERVSGGAVLRSCDDRRGGGRELRVRGKRDSVSGELQVHSSRMRVRCEHVSRRVHDGRNAVLRDVSVLQGQRAGVRAVRGEPVQCVQRGRVHVQSGSGWETAGGGWTMHAAKRVQCGRNLSVRADAVGVRSDVLGVRREDGGYVQRNELRVRSDESGSVRGGTRVHGRSMRVRGRLVRERVLQRGGVSVQFDHTVRKRLRRLQREQHDGLVREWSMHVRDVRAMQWKQYVRAGELLL